MKQCTNCKKQKQIWKNRTIDGVKMNLCKTCNNLIDKETKKKKKEAIKEKKRLSTSALIKELDTIFSMYIRLRDSNQKGMFDCCTCGKTYDFSHLQAGHFRSRRLMNTRWNEKNVHGQCKACNIILKGEEYKHSLHIDKTYGEGTALLILKESESIKKFAGFELLDLIEMYKKKAKKLADEKQFTLPLTFKVLDQ